jgi:transposase
MPARSHLGYPPTMAKPLLIFTVIRNVVAFEELLVEAQDSKLPEFVSVAAGLAKDAAVRAALTYDWCNGQAEGQVNRLKMIKRQMFGRANFDLFRRQVLHCAT